MSMAALCACKPAEEPPPKPQRYAVRYLADDGGTVQGKTYQYLYSEEGTEEVVAVADKGYKFLCWSDGYMEPVRQGDHITHDVEYTDYFRETVSTVSLDYAFGQVEGEKKESFRVTVNNCDDYVFPVPTREHYTFDGWYFGDKRITDEKGRCVVGHGLLDVDANGLQARWTPLETFTYTILVVYVTDIEADLPRRNNTATLHVDYKMSDLEREFCKKTTEQLERFGSFLTDGLVNFEVTEYFTTETVVKENFEIAYSSELNGITLMADGIPEVADMIDDYDFNVTVSSLNEHLLCTELDYNIFRDYNGIADRWCASVCLDIFMDGFRFTYPRLTLSDLLEDLDNEEWYGYMVTFYHELAHCIWFRFASIYELHEAIYPVYSYDSVKKLKAYYNCEHIKDGEKLGIPYEVWSRNIVTATYRVDRGDYSNYPGYISVPDGIYASSAYESDRLSETHRVPYGRFVPKATAVPYSCFRFVRWSDGVTTAERDDKDLTADLDVTAYFEPIEYTVKVVATPGGRVSCADMDDGTVKLSMQNSNTDACLFSAVADDGYRFVGWSTGKTNDRYVFILQNENKLFDENDFLELTAVFEPIE